MKTISLAFSPKRAAVGLAMAAVVGGGSFAYTASNTVGGTRAGDGAGTISGYSVSNVSYTNDATTPTEIDVVTFDLDAAASTVKAKATSAGTSYTACQNTAATTWTCDFSPNVAVGAADQLSVVANQ